MITISAILRDFFALSDADQIYNGRNHAERLANNAADRERDQRIIEHPQRRNGTQLHPAN